MRYCIVIQGNINKWKKQGKLNIQAEKKLETVEEYKFDIRPIKVSQVALEEKKTFTSTILPLIKKESYGASVNGFS
jgi:hypothetical protein